MSDPFRTSSKNQLLREAQIGLSVVAVLLVILVYVAFYRITGRGREIPEHVRNAPIAQTAWPNAISPQVAARRIVTKRDPSVVPEKEPIVDSVADFKTQTSDTTKSLNKANRSKTTEAAQDWPNSSTKSISSFTQPLSTTENDLHTPKSHRPDVMPPMTVGILNDHQSSTSEVAPAAFDNDLRNSIPVATNRENSRTIEFSQNPNLEVATHPKPSFSPVMDDRDNRTPKGEGVAKMDDPSVVSSESEFPFNNFRPKDLIPETVTANQSSNSDSSIDQRSNFPSSESNPPIEPMVSVLDPASRASAGPGKHELNANAALGQSFGDSKTQPTKSSGQPALIAAKPIPLTDEFEFATPLRHVPRNPARLTESQPKSIIQQPSVDPIESTTPKWTYRVEDGDSFWSIAEQVYGDGRFFRALYKYNEPLFPNFDDLTPGASLGTPLREDLIKLFPDACPEVTSANSAAEADDISDSEMRIYVTQESDTLFEIARQKLGQASRYLEIKEMNRLRLDSRVNHLTPLRKGVRLVLPFE
jgi:nucleoid-associated protein YgaU